MFVIFIASKLLPKIFETAHCCEMLKIRSSIRAGRAFPLNEKLMKRTSEYDSCMTMNLYNLTEQRKTKFQDLFIHIHQKATIQIYKLYYFTISLYNYTILLKRYPEEDQKDMTTPRPI